MKKTWTDEQLIEAAKLSKSKSEVCRRLKLTLGGTYRMLSSHFLRLGIDTSHFLTGKELTNYAREQIRSLSLEDISKVRKYRAGRHIKNKILKEKIFEYVCSTCNINTWQGHKLTLHLDHINGDPLDNHIENLRFLCPNCHSLTPTYCKTKTIPPRTPKFCKDCGIKIGYSSTRCRKCSDADCKRPTKVDWSQFDIVTMVENSNYSNVGRKLNVSGVTIKKHYIRLKNKLSEKPIDT